MSPRFALINQECALFHFCISTGLTKLKQPTDSNKGSVYVAFFNLSIGLERILKLIVIADYWLDNNEAYPTRAYVKAKGHKLVKLASECEQIIKKRNLKAAHWLKNDSINTLILETLSNFAEGSRYANLDNLEHGLRLNDPLNKWNEILNIVFHKEVPAKAAKTALLWPRYLTSQTNAFSALPSAGFDGTIHGFKEQLTETMIHKASTPYICRHICYLIKPFKSALDELFSMARLQETTTESFPYSDEYLLFLNLDNSDLLRMKMFTK